MNELDDQARAILDFERGRWKYSGAKDSAILERFGLTPTRYYQRLDAILDDPAALAFDPVGVHRLRRLRSTRRSARSSKRLNG